MNVWEINAMKDTNKVYEFTVKVVGIGVSESDAWDDAYSSLMADPGSPESSEIIEDNAGD